MSGPGGRGLGYRADGFDARDRRYASSPQALPSVCLPAPDLRGFVGRVRDQEDTSSCVGQAVAAAIELTSLARDGKPLHVSARYLYAIAREAEGREGALADDGSFPRLLMQATRARGIVPERAFPFSVSAIDERPSPLVAVSAYAWRGLAYFRIEATGEDRLAQCDDALRRGCAVVFGGGISADYRENDGAEVRAMGPSIGGHMQVLVRGGDRPLVLNSWGRGWGAGGLVAWDRDLFAHHAMSDVYAITGVPHD